jgi:hypothetical protein
MVVSAKMVGSAWCLFHRRWGRAAIHEICLRSLLRLPRSIKTPGQTANLWSALKGCTSLMLKTMYCKCRYIPGRVSENTKKEGLLSGKGEHKYTLVSAKCSGAGETHRDLPREEFLARYAFVRPNTSRCTSASISEGIPDYAPR